MGARRDTFPRAKVAPTNELQRRRHREGSLRSASLRCGGVPGRRPMEEDDVEALAERAGNALADGELQTAAQLLQKLTGQRDGGNAPLGPNGCVQGGRARRDGSRGWDGTCGSAEAGLAACRRGCAHAQPASTSSAALVAVSSCRT